jgi:transposase-like protein
MMGIALEVRMSKKTKQRRRRQFTAEFKADAVRLVTKGGLSFA